MRDSDVDMHEGRERFVLEFHIQRKTEDAEMEMGKKKFWFGKDV